VHGIARYKPDSRRHADVAGATVSEEDCVVEAEMTDTDTSNGVATDSDDDDGDDDDDGNDDVGRAAEVSQFIQGKSITHTYTADSSTACSKASSHIDADAVQKPRVSLESSQDKADSSRAGIDRKIDQEVPPAHTSEPSDTSHSGLNATRREREDDTGHDYGLDDITCVESSDRPLQDVWQAQKPQNEQAYWSTATKCADSRFAVDRRVSPSSENDCLTMASVAGLTEPDLARSRTTVDSNGRDD
jgi:hypothetical protein